MNEELSKYLLETLKDTTTFVKEQAPEVAKQALDYGLWKTKFKLMCVVLFIFVSTILTVLAFQTLEKPSEKLLVFLCCFAINIIPIIEMFMAIATLKQISIAPKLYLIESVRK